MKKRNYALHHCTCLYRNHTLFPLVTTRSVSGNGEVLTSSREKVGDCSLAIEIQEVASLARCYHKQFSFTLDGNHFTEFHSHSHAETQDGLCLISQMYYDTATDSMALCSLVYPEDLSYAVIRWNENLYFFNNGTSIPYSALPVS